MLAPTFVLIPEAWITSNGILLLPSVIVEKGKDKGVSAEIKEGGILTIGRDSSSDLRLTDTLASRRHCRIETRSGRCFIVDVGSRNGTFLNGRRVREEEVAPGDRILVGETLIAFQTEPPTVDPLIGREIGGCRILQLLGKGGMGRVYKTRQLSLDRIIAIKILSKQYAGNKSFIERFRSEAMALARLSHPNIVAVYDVGESAGFHYILMEYMQGGSISRRISRGRKLPPKKAVKMILDVARGLVYAEEKGVVHRDIKPENMMLDNLGNVKICDLGIAQTIDQAHWNTRPQGVFGSPHYMAPEQARGEAADHRSDIYSLGASFYRIITGSTMFTGRSARDLILKHLNEAPRPVDELEPTLPHDLCKVIHTMTCKDSLGRYQTAREVVEALEAVQRKMAKPRITSAAIRKRWDPGRSGKKRAVAVLVAVAVIAGLLVLWHLLSRHLFR